MTRRNRNEIHKKDRKLEVTNDIFYLSCIDKRSKQAAFGSFFLNDLKMLINSKTFMFLGPPITYTPLFIEYVKLVCEEDRLISKKSS